MPKDSYKPKLIPIDPEIENGFSSRLLMSSLISSICSFISWAFKVEYEKKKRQNKIITVSLIVL